MIFQAADATAAAATAAASLSFLSGGDDIVVRIACVRSLLPENRGNLLSRERSRPIWRRRMREKEDGKHPGRLT